MSSSTIMSSDDIESFSQSSTGAVGEAIKNIAIGACHGCGKKIERKRSSGAGWKVRSRLSRYIQTRDQLAEAGDGIILRNIFWYRCGKKIGRRRISNAGCRMGVSQVDAISDSLRFLRWYPNCSEIRFRCEGRMEKSNVCSGSWIDETLVSMQEAATNSRFLG